MAGTLRYHLKTKTMKTTNFIIAALLFSGQVLLAQNEKKAHTVRIKKIENINGVQKVTDTTFTTTSFDTLQLLPEGLQQAKENLPGDIQIHTFILNDKSSEGSESAGLNMDWVSKTLKEDLEKLKDEKSDGMTAKVIVQESESTGEPESAEKISPKKYTRVIVIKKLEILDLTNEELKLIGKQNGKPTASLTVESLQLSPNPSSGGVDMQLFLPKKGPTTISVYNSSGQEVHTEALGEFTGTYSGSLDLSAQPRGVYFLHVQQNNESISKKILLQ